MKTWPEDWPKFYHGREACDMVEGPCICQAWHLPGEFQLVDGVVVRTSTPEEKSEDP